MDASVPCYLRFSMPDDRLDDLPAKLRKTLWSRFEPRHRSTSSRDGNQPFDGMPNDSTGRPTRNIEA